MSLSFSAFPERADMAKSAGISCTDKSCTGLVFDGVCNVCGKTRRRQLDREYDSKRGSSTDRGYGSNWRRTRAMFLRRYPLCEDCLFEGRTEAATEVHHITAKRDGGSNEFSNLMALCRSHHSKRTARGE